MTNNGEPFPPGPAGTHNDKSRTASYAVLDCETTGFSPAKGATVLELAIVSLDAGGDIVDEWDTLLNPGGPVGAEWVHGITAQMVADAPRFAEVADELGERLARRVIVAHNAPFDMRFLHAMTHTALGSRWAPEVLCTQRLAGDFLPPGPRKLVDCCRAVGIRLDNAHSALGDARATTRLFRHYLHHAPRPLPWADMLTRAAAAPPWPRMGLPQRPIQPRRWTAAGG